MHSYQEMVMHGMEIDGWITNDGAAPRGIGTV